MLTDNVSDLLTRIRNGQQQKLNSIYVFKTKLNINILKCLIKEGFIKNYSFITLNDFYMKVFLKYDENNVGVIRRLVRISKPSRRIYISLKTLIKYHKQNSGHSMLILSTNKGIMSHVQALNLELGGEVICKII